MWVFKTTMVHDILRTKALIGKTNDVLCKTIGFRVLQTFIWRLAPLE